LASGYLAVEFGSAQEIEIAALVGLRYGGEE
jgi:hypothetical protein